MVAVGPSNDIRCPGDAITDRGLYLLWYLTLSINGQKRFKKGSSPPRHGIPHPSWASLPYPVSPWIPRVVAVAPSNDIWGLGNPITDRGLYLAPNVTSTINCQSGICPPHDMGFHTPARLAFPIPCALGSQW